MSSVRELLEQAAAVEPQSHRAPPVAEIRRRGDRRRRRSQVAGAAVAVASVAAAVVVGARVLDAPVGPDPLPPVAVSPSPTPTPSLSGQQVTGMAGTRWIPDLVQLAAVSDQAYPDDKGDLPRAMLRFEPGGVLLLDVMLPGRPTVSVRGTWQMTTTGTAVLDPLLKADLRLGLVAPAGAPDAVVTLVSRLSLVTVAEGYLPQDPPPSIQPLSLFLYGPSHTTVYGVIDAVRPGVVLPSPYPSGG